MNWSSVWKRKAKITREAFRGLVEKFIETNDKTLKLETEVVSFRKALETVNHETPEGNLKRYMENILAGDTSNSDGIFMVVNAAMIYKLAVSKPHNPFVSLAIGSEDLGIQKARKRLFEAVDALVS